MFKFSSWKVMLQLFLFLLLVWPSPAATSFTVNQKYSFVGRSVVNMAAHLKGESPLNWRKVVTICFSKAFTNMNVVGAASVGSIEVRDISNMLSFQVGLNGISNYQLLVYIKSVDASKISSLSISYLLYYNQPSYGQNIFTTPISSNFGGTAMNISSKASSLSKQWVTPAAKLNQAGNVIVIVMLTGVSAYSSADEATFDIGLIGQFDSTTSNIISKIITNSSKETSFQDIDFVIFAYNSDFVNSPSSKIHNIYSGTISAMFHQDESLEMTSFNTFIGLTSFSITSQTVFSFSPNITSSNTFMVTSNNTFSSISFSFIVFYSNYCGYSTPYFEYTTQQCYMTCPENTTADDIALSCVCVINGTTFSSSVCFPSVTQSLETSKVGFTVGVVVGGMLTLCLLVVVAYLMYSLYCKVKFEAENPQKQGTVKTASNIASKGHIEGNNQIGILSHWAEATDHFSLDKKCCKCDSGNSLFESNCGHFYHARCWSITKQKQKMCSFPQCKLRLSGEVKYYCKICQGKFKLLIIQHDFDKILVDQGQCDDCLHGHRGRYERK